MKNRNCTFFSKLNARRPRRFGKMMLFLLCLLIFIECPMTIFASEASEIITMVLPTELQMENESEGAVDTEKDNDNKTETDTERDNDNKAETDTETDTEADTKAETDIKRDIDANLDVLAVELPVVDETKSSPFDFLLDPEGLIYATNAMRYGGGKVEQDTFLYFRNRTGPYDFSHESDRLTVTNKSDVPVKVTVFAWVDGGENINLSQTENFGDSEDPDIYLALVDDSGNEYPLAKDGKVCIENEMKKMDDELPVTYSFGLKGACNANGDWSDVDVSMKVRVQWKVDPIVPDVDAEAAEDKENKRAEEDKEDEEVAQTEENDGQEEDEEVPLDGTHD